MEVEYLDDVPQKERTLVELVEVTSFFDGVPLEGQPLTKLSISN